MPPAGADADVEGFEPAPDMLPAPRRHHNLRFQPADALVLLDKEGSQTPELAAQLGKLHSARAVAIHSTQ